VFASGNTQGITFCVPFNDSENTDSLCFDEYADSGSMDTLIVSAYFPYDNVSYLIFGEN
jgi:hypothetical protein